MADEKILKILLEYVTDKSSVGQAKAALKDIEKSIDNSKSRLKDLTKLLDDDLAKSTGKWASKLSEVDKISRGLEQVGRDLGLTWVEGLGSATGSAVQLLETLGQIKGLAGGFGGAGGLGGLGALGLGAAGLLGAGLGAAGYEGLRSAGIAKGASLGQFASVGAYGVGSLFGQDTANKWFETVAKWTGEISDEAPKAADGLNKLKNSVQQAATIAYETNSNLIATQQTAIRSTGYSPGNTSGITLGSRSGMRRYAQQKAAEKEEEEARKFETERTKIIRAAKDEELKAEMDYQRERKQAIERFNLETKQQEKQHQIQIKRLKEDAAAALTQAERNRDAVSYLQQWEASQKEIERAEEDYQEEQKARKDAFDQQLEQEKEDFKALQAQRKLAAARQLDDLKATLSQETSIRKRGHDAILKDTKDFMEQMQDMFSQLSYSSSSSVNQAVDKRISQTLR